MNLELINAWRVRKGPYGSSNELGLNGAFMLTIPGEARKICVLASDGSDAPPGFPLWKHVSVSFVSFGAASSKTPSWEVMAWVKDLFWEPEDWVVQFHPAHSTYVNDHPGVLHLWSPVPPTPPLPTPPSIYVGVGRKHQP